MRTDIPDFRAGDTLKVHARVVEGNRSRDPDLPGRRDPPPGRWPAGDLHDPQGQLRRRRRADVPDQQPAARPHRGRDRGDVRRAKLYYLRDLRGKKAKIKELRDKVAG
jgi:large subunit ribosomal protein L19